jgi:hypothetical protein
MAICGPAVGRYQGLTRAALCQHWVGVGAGGQGDRAFGAAGVPRAIRNSRLLCWLAEGGRGVGKGDWLSAGPPADKCRWADSRPGAVGQLESPSSR